MCFVVESARGGSFSSVKQRRWDAVTTVWLKFHLHRMSDGGCGHVIQGGGYRKTLLDIIPLRDNSECIDGNIQGYGGD